MGQGNLRGRAANTHGHGTELMPGIAALDRLGGGNFDEKRTGTKGKKTGVGSVVMMRFQSPPTIASCILSGECWSVHELEG